MLCTSPTSRWCLWCWAPVTKFEWLRCTRAQKLLGMVDIRRRARISLLLVALRVCDLQAFGDFSGVRHAPPCETLDQMVLLGTVFSFSFWCLRFFSCFRNVGFPLSIVARLPEVLRKWSTFPDSGGQGHLLHCTCSEEQRKIAIFTMTAYCVLAAFHI